MDGWETIVVSFWDGFLACAILVSGEGMYDVWGWGGGLEGVSGSRTEENEYSNYVEGGLTLNSWMDVRIVQIIAADIHLE